jgi:hypothetical protein
MMIGSQLVKEICLLLCYLLEIFSHGFLLTGSKTQRTMKSNLTLNLLALVLAADLGLAIAQILPRRG